jgi:hypothetical protein
MMVIVSLDSPSCEVPCWILLSVVYRDVTRQAKGVTCRCLTGFPPRDIPKVVSFGWEDAEIRNSKVQGTQSLDRFGPQDA